MLKVVTEKKKKSVRELAIGITFFPSKSPGWIILRFEFAKERRVDRIRCMAAFVSSLEE